MKLLFLCKRRPQHKDLLKRPYGRFYYLPRLLAEKGHEVYVLLLSYRSDPALLVKIDGAICISESLFWRGPQNYITRANELARKIGPDWIVGLSDTYYGILAQYLAKKHGTRSAIDAYDNYESYIPWCKPLHLLWRRALARATLVTAAGPHLAQFLASFRTDQKATIVPMAADPTGFEPLDKIECRRKMGLPLNKQLIGYCGAIYRNRGIEIVFQVFEYLRREDPNLKLILTGRKQKGIQLPDYVRWLGYVPDSHLPIILNCMDVLLVPNQLSAFGQFSYPVKLYEAMNCQIPLVATATEAAKWILNDRKQFLADPEDPDDHAQKVKNLLQLGRFDYGEKNTWKHSCDIFETALLNQN